MAKTEYKRPIKSITIVIQEGTKCYRVGGEYSGKLIGSIKQIDKEIYEVLDMQELLISRLENCPVDIEFETGAENLPF